MIRKAYKYRIYPTEEQKILINKHIDSCRFIYNLALETKIEAYKSGVSLSRFDLGRQLPDLKEECPWLKEVNSQSLIESIRNLDHAFKRFYEGQNSFPKFKKKKNNGSFSLSSKNKVDFKNGLFKGLKFSKGIKTKFHRIFEGKIKTCTISKTPTDKYFVSILVEQNKSLPSKPKVLSEDSVGIDLGIKSFAVTSDAEVIDNPKFLKNNIDRLKVLQRRASKKKKDSKNYKKATKEIALQHEKITNKRKDFLHKLSSRFISENQTICLEDLAASNMIKNHKLAQSISDASWNMFNKMIKYKADWYGVNILRINRFVPSSKMCFCGAKNNNLTLSDRTWTCKNCGRVNERDLLAAQNIKRFALNNYSGRGSSVGSVELSTLVEAKKQKAQNSSEQSASSKAEH